jgi:hypothetical protein
MKTSQNDSTDWKYLDEQQQSQNIFQTNPNQKSNYIYSTLSKESKFSPNQQQRKTPLQISTNAPVTTSTTV